MIGKLAIAVAGTMLCGTAFGQAVVPVPEAPDAALAILPGDAAQDPDTRIAAAIAADAQRHRGIAQRAQPMGIQIEGQPFRLHSVTYADSPRTMQAFLATPGSAGICHVAVPIDRAGANMRAVGRACVAALGKGAAAGAAASAASPRPARPAAAPAGKPGAHQANWSKVEGVYFKSFTGFGVGGGVTMDFEPIVLFRDGSYYEVEGPALEDVDLAGARAREPRNWGSWRRQGASFILTDNRGRSNDHQLQQGSFFKAFPASAAPLRGTFESVGGGGNSALGGDVTIASTDRLVFNADGSFGTRRSTGALNSGATSGVGSAVAARRAGGGRFSVRDHTLTLTHADGRTERRFFAFGSRRTPAQVAPNMIFVGETVYTLDD